jgi:hypothetical protein
MALVATVDIPALGTHVRVDNAYARIDRIDAGKGEDASRYRVVITRGHRGDVLAERWVNFTVDPDAPLWRQAYAHLRTQPDFEAAQDDLAAHEGDGGDGPVELREARFAATRAISAAADQLVDEAVADFVRRVALPSMPTRRAEGAMTLMALSLARKRAEGAPLTSYDEVVDAAIARVTETHDRIRTRQQEHIHAIDALAARGAPGDVRDYPKNATWG